MVVAARGLGHGVEVREAAIDQAAVGHAFRFGLHFGADREVVATQVAAIGLLLLARVERSPELSPKGGAKLDRA